MLEVIPVAVVLAILTLPAVYIEATKARRPTNAATGATYLFALGSLFVIPCIGIAVEAIGFVVGLMSLLATPVTFGASLAFVGIVMAGLAMELVATVLAWKKLLLVLGHTLAGTISDGRAIELIGTSYAFAAMGIFGLGALGEMAEAAELGDIADLDGFADLGSQEIAELDSDGYGPADSTYGTPSEVDGDPRTSHYVEGYSRSDGTNVQGHWKGKRG